MQSWPICAEPAHRRYDIVRHRTRPQHTMGVRRPLQRRRDGIFSNWGNRVRFGFYAVGYRCNARWSSLIADRC